MAANPHKYRPVVAVALVGLGLAATGLWLAFLSNPKRFSLHPSEDRHIGILALAGFGCTLAGVGLFLGAVRRTTLPMPIRSRTNANLGVGIGFILQLAGVFVHEATRLPSSAGLALILVSLPAMIWGTMHYAEGKGLSRWFGLLGATGILGLIVLVLLPLRHTESPPAGG